MVRHTGPAHRAQEDGVELAQRLDTVRRHHRAVALEPLARPVELGVGQLDSVPLRHRVEHRTGGRDHLAADPVARDDGDGLRGHPPSPRTLTINGSSRMIRNAPAMSKITPERIMVVIGTTPEP